MAAHRPPARRRPTPGRAARAALHRAGVLPLGPHQNPRLGHHPVVVHRGVPRAPVAARHGRRHGHGGRAGPAGAAGAGPGRALLGAGAVGGERGGGAEPERDRSRRLAAAPHLGRVAGRAGAVRPGALVAGPLAGRSPAFLIPIARGRTIAAHAQRHHPTCPHRRRPGPPRGAGPPDAAPPRRPAGHPAGPTPRTRARTPRARRGRGQVHGRFLPRGLVGPAHPGPRALGWRPVRRAGRGRPPRARRAGRRRSAHRPALRPDLAGHRRHHRPRGAGAAPARRARPGAAALPHRGLPWPVAARGVAGTQTAAVGRRHRRGRGRHRTGLRRRAASARRGPGRHHPHPAHRRRCAGR